MAPSIGVNLRVTGHCNQGGRKYMEDMFSVAYQQTEDEKDLEYAFFGIFDGHGGREAAMFAKEHLMDSIVSQKNFWSDKDENVLKAIHDGFVSTHYAMWKELETWPKTASGLPSTSGTTASVAFIRRGKIYVGHVGDSAVVLGYQDEGDSTWKARPLTRDHKPECEAETERILQSGGKVICKSGVPRVVWNRPRLGHRGPVRRSTHIDEIPFLAVARSLGDLWSYNSSRDQFVVSPEPDVRVIPVDVVKHRCLILGTDGLWNMLTPEAAVHIVLNAERHNEKHVLSQEGSHGRTWTNPSKKLVDGALEKWTATRLRADNTSVVTVMLDPPGPPRAQVLLRQKQRDMASNQVRTEANTPHMPSHSQSSDSQQEEPCTSESLEGVPKGGVAIFTRHPVTGESMDCMASSSSKECLRDAAGERLSPDSSSGEGGKVREVTRILHDQKRTVQKSKLKNEHSCKSDVQGSQAPDQQVVKDVKSDDKTDASSKFSLKEKSGDIQINEVSSSIEEVDKLKVIPQDAAKPGRDKGKGSKPASTDEVCSSGTAGIGVKRRHSVAKVETSDQNERYEPCQKRRTRSEDKRPAEDEFSTSDTENERVSWPHRRLRGKSGCGQWDDVHLKYKQLNEKIKQIEKKVARRTQELNHEVKILKSSLLLSSVTETGKVRKTSEVSEVSEPTRTLRSSNTHNLASRTLRSRNINVSQPVDRSKRKGGLLPVSESSVAKSVRVSSRNPTVWTGSPRRMVTRSKIRRLQK